MHQFKRMLTATSTLAAALHVAPSVDAFTYSFLVEESTDFTGNGCTNTDLNNVGGQLKTALVDADWGGNYLKNAAAQPQDFRDSSVVAGGLDHSFADNKHLAVYAGHGNVSQLGWGFSNGGACSTLLSTQARLGTANGNTARNAMYLTSCTMKKTSSHTGLFKQQLHQQFGYHNSPAIGDSQPANWFFMVQLGNTNRFAWLETMEDKPGWGTGDNSPRIMSFSNSNEFWCWQKHYGARLGHSYNSAATEPHAVFCAQTRDNGTSNTCS